MRFLIKFAIALVGWNFLPLGEARPTSANSSAAQNYRHAPMAVGGGPLHDKTLQLGR